MFDCVMQHVMITIFPEQHEFWAKESVPVLEDDMNICAHNFQVKAYTAHS